MNAQLTLIEDPLGYAHCAEWCAKHPEATRFIVHTAKCVNKTGRKARISECMELCLADPAKYGMVAGGGRVYGSDRNMWPQLSRYLEATRGVEFTKRRSKFDQFTGPR